MTCKIFSSTLWHTFLCAFVFVAFSACSQEKQESEEIAANELDTKTYAGLEDVFSSTNTIETKGKYMLLIFGANGCKYCENLKDDIKQTQALKDELKAHFTSYYINTSYSKLHTFKVGEGAEAKEHAIPTRKLAEIYRIGPTPTLIFADKDGRSILAYPAYLPPKQFQALLGFIASGTWKSAQGDDKRLTQMLQQHLQAI